MKKLNHRYVILDGASVDTDTFIPLRTTHIKNGDDIIKLMEPMAVIKKTDLSIDEIDFMLDCYRTYLTKYYGKWDEEYVNSLCAINHMLSKNGHDPFTDEECDFYLSERKKKDNMEEPTAAELQHLSGFKVEKNIITI